MKATLEFNLDKTEERLAHKRCVNADGAYLALHCVANEIFRPHRKHGYDMDIQKYIEADDTQTGDNNCLDVISKLEDRFYELLERYSINLSDLE